GRHHVQVRARMVGAPASADPSPATVELLVDTLAPVGAVTIAGTEARFAATDRVSPTDALVYRWRASDEAGGSEPGGSDWSPTAPLDLAAAYPGVTDESKLAGIAAGALRVEVRDEAGNVAALTVAGAPAPAAGGCDVGRGRGDGGLL